MSAEAFRRLIDTIAACGGTTRARVLSKRTLKPDVVARHVAAWIVRRVYGVTLRETAWALHWRDHTNVVHACHAVESELRAGTGRRLALLLDVMGVMARGG